MGCAVSHRRENSNSIQHHFIHEVFGFDADAVRELRVTENNVLQEFQDEAFFQGYFLHMQVLLVVEGSVGKNE